MEVRSNATTRDVKQESTPHRSSPTIPQGAKKPMRHTWFDRPGRVQLMLAVLVTLALPHLARAQTGSVTGTVTSSGAGSAPLPDSRVLVAGTNLGVTTNQDGKFTLRGVPTGPVIIQVFRVGYIGQKKTVTVTAGQTSTADFSMERAVVTTWYRTSWSRSGPLCRDFAAMPASARSSFALDITAAARSSRGAVPGTTRCRSRCRTRGRRPMKRSIKRGSANGFVPPFADYPPRTGKRC